MFVSDVLLSWNVTILDGDGHKIIDNGLKEQVKPATDYKIVIGSHVWICSNVTILKGSFISNNSIISCNSTVSKKFFEEGLVIGSNIILKRNINWQI